LHRLAIITSHPIQYNAPLFKILAQREDLNVKVFYSWKGTEEKVDPEFGEKITWDIPLLEGYEYSFVDNKAKDPGTHHFFGLDNPEMVSEINRWGANSILIYGWSSKTHLSVMRYFYGRIPIFFRGDSTLLSGGNTFRKIFRKIWLKWVYQHIDFAFYPGVRSKEYFLSNSVPSNKLLHVPHSIDNRRFSDDSNHYEQIAQQQRHKMKIPDDAIVLLFAGKFVERKQPIMLLKAVQEIVNSDSSLNLHLIYVGTGPLLSELNEASRKCEYIHILGFKNQTEMPVIYRLGDIYVLPSKIETWGLGVNEAMACSRPVIVGNKVGCAPDLVKSTISGEIFDSDNIEDLKNTLHGFIKEKSRIYGMRESSYKFIKDWSIEKSAEQTGNYIIERSIGSSL